jgi:low affinity Fe/Cu permease
MNKFATKLARMLGSLPFITFNVIFFSIWIVMHYTVDFDPTWSLITVVMSFEAILLALLILRAENTQVAHIEKLLMRDLAQEKQELKLLVEIEKEVEDRK